MCIRDSTEAAGRVDHRVVEGGEMCGGETLRFLVGITAGDEFGHRGRRAVSSRPPKADLAVALYDARSHDRRHTITRLLPESAIAITPPCRLSPYGQQSVSCPTSAQRFSPFDVKPGWANT